MSRQQIYFNWKNVEYTVDHNFDRVGFVKLSTGEILGIGNRFWQIKTGNPQIEIPVCLLLLGQEKIIQNDHWSISVMDVSPHFSRLLEVSQGLDYTAIAHPYMDRFICPTCNEIKLTSSQCQQCGSNIKHEVVLEWPDKPPITTKYGVHVVTSQAICPNCQSDLDLDRQPPVCPNCTVRLQWHISPSTPHIAY